VGFRVAGSPPRPSRTPRGARLVIIGWCEFDLLFGDVHSLKQKRSVVRPLVAELRRRFDVSVAEVGAQQLYRRAGIGVGLVGSDAAHVREVLDACERLVAGHPEFDLLAARTRLIDAEDM